MEFVCLFATSHHELKVSLERFFAAQDLRLVEVPLAPGNGWESEQGNHDHILTAEGPSGTSVLMEEHCEGLYDRAEHLSAGLKRVVLAVQFYESYWGYDFFVDGKVVDRFLTDARGYFQAQYFRELPGDEAPLYQGRPQLVARHAPGVDAARIAKYVVPWTEPFLKERGGTKAYPTDEATYGDVEQAMDFVQALGFRHPVDERGRPVGKILDTQLPEAKEGANSKWAQDFAEEIFGKRS